MNKKEIMREFINVIKDNGLLSKFIMNIFDYVNINDNNYFFRTMIYDNSLILDIYDNISSNKFNRYVFNFDLCGYSYKIEIVDKLCVHRIGVFNVHNTDNKLIKLAYLFTLSNVKMLEYAGTFLEEDFVLILNDIIK